MRIAKRSCVVMMNSYRQSSGLPLRGRPRNERKRLIVVSILVIVLLTIDVLTGGKIRALVRVSASNIWKGGIFVEEAIRRSGFFTSRAGLEAEITALNEQLALYQARAAAYQGLKNENTALRDMLNIAESKRGITATIVSSFRASPYGTFLIGAGSMDDITPGNIVLTGENFVLGRVADVSAHTALVNELFADGVSTDALIRGVGTSVEGRGGGNARADVPREAQIEIGDPVISPVLEGRTIGLVGAVVEDSASAYKKVYIRLPVNLAALRFVYVIKN